MNKLLLETATGRDWQLASDAERLEFCAHHRTHAFSGEALRHALDVLLEGRGKSLAELNLREAVAMIAGAWPTHPEGSRAPH